MVIASAFFKLLKFLACDVVVDNDAAAPGHPPFDPMSSSEIYMFAEAVACHYTPCSVYLISEEEEGF